MFSYEEYNIFCSLILYYGIFCDTGSKHRYDGSCSAVFHCYGSFYGRDSNFGSLILYYGIFHDTDNKHRYVHSHDVSDGGGHVQMR